MLKTLCTAISNNENLLITNVELNARGDYRITVLQVCDDDIITKIGKTYYVVIHGMRTPSEEFLSECEEVHAFGVGIFHSFTHLKPLKYSEIEEDGLSPDLVIDLQDEYHYYLTGFWGIRVIIAIIFLYITGLWSKIPVFFGW